MQRQAEEHKKALDALEKKRIQEREELKRQMRLKEKPRAARMQKNISSKRAGSSAKLPRVIEAFEKERNIFDVTEEGVAAVVSALSRRIVGEYIDLNPHIGKIR